MDEQLALLAIQSSLCHARELYETLLYDKLQNKADYSESIGHADILAALDKVKASIKLLEE